MCKAHPREIPKSPLKGSAKTSQFKCFLSRCSLKCFAHNHLIELIFHKGKLVYNSFLYSKFFEKYVQKSKDGDFLLK